MSTGSFQHKSPFQSFIMQCMLIHKPTNTHIACCLNLTNLSAYYKRSVNFTFNTVLRVTSAVLDHARPVSRTVNLRLIMREAVGGA